MTSPTERFTSRVENYVKYRPSYPAAVVDTLAHHAGLYPNSVIVDVGSGTGISAKLLLDRGYTVVGIEPNAAMRGAAEQFLANYPQFTSVNATAEATTLPSASVDLVLAGQAFHWFDQNRTRAEFARILRPTGSVALMWNQRLDSTPFLREYDHLIASFGSHYHEVRHETVSREVVETFFAPNQVTIATFENAQHLDYDGFEGRLLSSSYTPQQGHANYAPMLAELRRIFGLYQQNGHVTIEYETIVYIGQLVAS